MLDYVDSLVTSAFAEFQRQWTEMTFEKAMANAIAMAALGAVCVALQYTLKACRLGGAKSFDTAKSIAQVVGNFFSPQPGELCKQLLQMVSDVQSGEWDSSAQQYRAKGIAVHTHAVYRELIWIKTGKNLDWNVLEDLSKSERKLIQARLAETIDAIIQRDKDFRRLVSCNALRECSQSPCEGPPKMVNPLIPPIPSGKKGA